MTASPRRPLPWLLFGLLATGGLAAATEASAPGPLAKEFPVATVSALLRPAVTRHLAAATNGRFHFVAQPGPVAAGDTIGRFDDRELSADLATAQLRLRVARQRDADFAAEGPARRQEAQTRVAELESRLALAEALVKNPALFRELPAATQAQLAHTEPAALRAQLEAAHARLNRLDAPDAAETSAARLEVLDAEHAVRTAETRLREAIVAAPFAGDFQPAPSIDRSAEGALLGTGQEIGTLRDVSRLVAAVPALSPYLVRVDPTRTLVRLSGPAGREFSAPFREAATELTPVMGDTRVFLYEFSAEDSRELAAMVQSNLHVRVVLLPAQPVVTVGKLAAALDHPDVFRAGWAAGVPQAWPGWRLACEGETTLGLTRTQP